MKEKYVVIRGVRARTLDPFRVPFALPGEAVIPTTTIRSEVNEMDRRDILAVARHTDVLAIAPIMPMKLISPIDTQLAAEPTDQEVTWGIQAIRANTSPFSGNGITVAVLDTGIDAAHPAFSGVEIIQKDFTGEGNGDNNGHGTHCAGTIFGRTINGKRIGVAPGIKKVLIGKVIGNRGGGSDQIVKAIQWAVENGANVISMSLGIDFPGFQRQLQEEFGLPPEIATSRALEGYRLTVHLFERLAAFVQSQETLSQATVIIAAAGNESQRAVKPDFEVAVSPPAVSEGIISVAALGQGTRGFMVASFSNTGANVSGPGVAVLSAKPGGGLKTLSGTSMATPHVAGVAALWAEKLKSTGQLNHLQLTARLIAAAVTEGLESGFDPFDIGAGMVQAPQG